MQRMRRFLALALVAWLALVVNPVGAMPMEMPTGAGASSSNAVAAVHSHEAHCHHSISAPATPKACCGETDHACVGGHCCGCAMTCGGAALPATALDFRFYFPAAAPSPRLLATTLAVPSAPPLRPPAA
jgi:hypothetical protein